MIDGAGHVPVDANLDRSHTASETDVTAADVTALHLYMLLTSRSSQLTSLHYSIISQKLSDTGGDLVRLFAVDERSGSIGL